MDQNNKLWAVTPAVGGLKRMEEYKHTIAQLFPAIPRQCIYQWSISMADALTLGYFLECYQREAIVLEIGTFVGGSTLYLAHQPKVLKVIGVDPNPSIAAELKNPLWYDEQSDEFASIDFVPLQDLRVHQVALAALAEFPNEQQKIELRTGIIGSSQAGTRKDPLGGPERVEVPVPDVSDGVSLVTFIDGLHTREAVQADLKAVFERNPRAIALLHDCRYEWGPFVQAGVARFIETSQHKYHFHLFERYGLGLGTPSLGVVCSDVDNTEIVEVLSSLHSPIQLFKRLASPNGVHTILHYLNLRRPVGFWKRPDSARVARN